MLLEWDREAATAHAAMPKRQVRSMRCEERSHSKQMTDWQWSAEERKEWVQEQVQ